MNILYVMKDDRSFIELVTNREYMIRDLLKEGIIFCDEPANTAILFNIDISTIKSFDNLTDAKNLNENLAISFILDFDKDKIIYQKGINKKLDIIFFAKDEKTLQDLIELLEDATLFIHSSFYRVDFYVNTDFHKIDSEEPKESYYIYSSPFNEKPMLEIIKEQVPIDLNKVDKIITLL